MSKQKISTGDSLRLLAAWYDEHPEMPNPFICHSVNEWPKDTVIQRLAGMAAMLKPCVKEIDNYQITLIRRFGCLEFRVIVSREAVCKKIVTYECPESLLEHLGRDEVDEALAVSDLP